MNDLRNFLNTAKAIQADMEQLGVSKPSELAPQAQEQAADEWEPVEYNDVINLDDSLQLRVVIDQSAHDNRVHLHIRKRVEGEWKHLGLATLAENYRLQRRRPAEPTS